MPTSPTELLRLRKLGWKGPPQSFPNREMLSYPADGLRALGFDGGHGFWFDHRVQQVARMLSMHGVTTLWDVGAGTGSMASRLAATGIDVVAVEPLQEGAAAIAARGQTVLVSTLDELHLPSASIEAIGLFDVVEHLKNPQVLLSEVSRVLRPDGVVVVTVPAFGWLWGDEDDVAGHSDGIRGNP